MYIEGRKKKQFAPKLAAELTVYLLLQYYQSFQIKSVMRQFGLRSERSVMRYVEELQLCGMNPPPERIRGGFSTKDGASLSAVGAPQSDKPHILHLNRLLRLCDACYDEIDETLFDEDGNPDYDESYFALTAADVLHRLPEPISLRSVQRDLLIIKEAMRQFSAFF